jgi:hypothetical protein
MARRCFYSFHYQPDCFRAAQVRQIGFVEGNQPATDNHWEEVTRGGDKAIRRWINDQLYGRSCTIVLVGQETANRKWINYEIRESWNQGMGVVGIRIHGLRNSNSETAYAGYNPFDYIGYDNAKNLSAIVKLYNPSGRDSKEKYAWISKHLSAAVEEAITIRKAN